MPTTYFYLQSASTTESIDSSGNPVKNYIYASADNINFQQYGTYTHNINAVLNKQTYTIVFNFNYIDNGKTINNILTCNYYNNSNGTYTASSYQTNDDTQNYAIIASIYFSNYGQKNTNGGSSSYIAYTAIQPN